MNKFLLSIITIHFAFVQTTVFAQSTKVRLNSIEKEIETLHMYIRVLDKQLEDKNKQISALERELRQYQKSDNNSLKQLEQIVTQNASLVQTNQKLLLANESLQKQVVELMEEVNKPKSRSSSPIVNNQLTNTNSINSTQKVETKKSSRSSSSSSYIRGPRGGCYYISSSGRKVYVDRSLCD